MRSSGAHCDPELAKRIGKKLGEKDRGGAGKEEEKEEEDEANGFDKI